MRKQSREVVFKMLFSYNFGQKEEPQTYDEMLDVILQDLGLDKQQLDLEIDVELGYDFETQRSKTGGTKNRMQELTILGKDGAVTLDSQNAYGEVILKIGFDNVKKNVLVALVRISSTLFSSKNSISPAFL